jgi:hypothetical protein
MSATSFITSPTPYVIWALAVLAALWGTYFGHPYVFAFTTLGLGWLTGAIGVLGIAICLFSKRVRTRDRALILASLLISAAAIAKALQTLGRFNWA